MSRLPGPTADRPASLGPLWRSAPGARGVAGPCVRPPRSVRVRTPQQAGALPIRSLDRPVGSPPTCRKVMGLVVVGLSCHDRDVASLAGADHDELVHAGLGPPHLAGPAEELAHIGR